MSLPSTVTSRDRRRADLHVHTIHSDGRHSMQQILDDAAQGLDLISICDHDTMGAYRGNWTLPEKLKLLPGIEMTCQVGDHDLHMLAYFPGGLTEEIHAWSRDLEEDRRERVLNGVHKLRESGLGLLWKDLEAEVGDSTPCRSHVARALVRSGLCSSPNQAFRQWLGKI
ncbi:MAG: PHP domain-containing protein, partial [Planctomycetota bacterium]